MKRMKLDVNREELADALAIVSSVAATRTPKDVLRTVLFDVHGDYCVVAATDLEISVRFNVTQVEVAQSGAILVTADRFSQIVRELRDETLHVESDGVVLHLSGKDADFRIVGQDPKEFPPVPQIEGVPDFEVAAGTLGRLAEWTTLAAARENTRYAINGVLWEQIADKLTMAATDGRRLSWAEGSLPASSSGEYRGIVPIKAMTMLQRVLSGGDEPVQVKMSSNQLVLRVAQATIGTALVEGRFPKYQDVIPVDCDKVAVLNTETFHSSLKLAALLTNEESKGVRFRFAEGTLTLSSRAPEQGEATVNMPVQYRGEELEIGFNPVFLMDVVRVVHDDEFELALKAENRPGLITCGPDRRYVVMPVNLS